MIKKTSSDPQLDMILAYSSILNKRALGLYENKKAWHNQFREQVLNRINEDIFLPLYSSDLGRPSVSIKVLVGMLILKESDCISDEKLFENSRFNLIFRSALGLMNINDPVPSESTYYLFKSKLVDYERINQTNLLKLVFESITKSQCIDFKITGKSVRMDSKLIGSNIAWSTRYELVHECLRLYYKDISSDKKIELKYKNEISIVVEEEAQKFIYTNNDETVNNKFNEIGGLIYRILKKDKNTNKDSYKIIKRVFNEQFKIINNIVIAKEKEEMRADNIQSPHDTDCTFRHKGGNSSKKQQVKGYSVNITETCDKENLNLITSVRLEKASISDQEFLQSEIQNSQLILPNKVESVNADGAYNSLENQKFCKENDITLYLSSLQSKTKRFELEPGDENSLMVLDQKTNIKHEACIIKNKYGEIKWRIFAEGIYRYFTKDKVDNFLLRKKITETPKELIERRNNVEASIFQLSYHCKNSKTRYRGIYKNRNWAILRTIWINFSRIKIHLEKNIDSLLSNYYIFTPEIKYDLIAYSYLFSKIFKLDYYKHSRSSSC